MNSLVLECPTNPFFDLYFLWEAPPLLSYFWLDFGESPVPVWTKEKRALFTSRLRSAHVTISYAIARCVANALIYGSKTIARYPVRELSA